MWPVIIIITSFAAATDASYITTTHNNGVGKGTSTVLECVSQQGFDHGIAADLS